MAVLCLRFCARASSSCGKWGPLLIAVRGPLTIAASPAAEHRLQTRRLSSCGSRAQLLRGMWDLPRPGLEPVSPALAGGFSTTAPPGKPQDTFLSERCKWRRMPTGCIVCIVFLLNKKKKFIHISKKDYFGLTQTYLTVETQREQNGTTVLAEMCNNM